MEMWVGRNGRFKKHRERKALDFLHRKLPQSCVNHLAQPDKPSAFLIRPPISYYRTYEEPEYTVSQQTYVLMKKCYILQLT